LKQIAVRLDELVGNRAGEILAGDQRDHNCTVRECEVAVSVCLYLDPTSLDGSAADRELARFGPTTPKPV
jgi:hypothetical protein